MASRWRRTASGRFQRLGTKTLKVWDLSNAQLVATFHCDARANCCAFADEHRIIAGDAGGRVYFLVLEE
jgi:hypothetical protein